MSQLLDQSMVNSEELVQLLKERAEGKADFLLVDVREDMEYEAGHIDGVDLLRPTSTFQEWSGQLLEEKGDRTIIFTCRTDYRSGQVQRVFEQNGHPRVINHRGGIVSYGGDIVQGK